MPVENVQRNRDRGWNDPQDHGLDGPLHSTIKTSHFSRGKGEASTFSSDASPNSAAHDIFAERSVNSRIQEEANSDTLLRVQIESSIQKTTFYVPVSLMLQREVEMLESAKRDGIDSERWSASRLFSLWKEKSRHEEITVLLTPEVSMKDHSTLKWEPWLSSCIRAYYNTGTIRIPDDALGSEILLALEYFGILTTSADQFVFDSFDAFQRVKQWSDYFTLRDHIAGWVLENLKAKGSGRRIWVTSENAMDMVSKEVLLQVGGDSATVLSTGLESSGYGLSCRVVSVIFKGKETGNQITRQAPARTRQDFCEHLKRSLPPRTKVTFDICSVRITKISTGRHFTETRPALKIQREDEADSSMLTQHEGSNESSANKSERSKPSSTGDSFGSLHEKQFKQAEKDIFGTDDSADRSSVSSRIRGMEGETLVLSSSNPYERIAGKDGTIGGAYRLQQDSTDNSGKASARSKHDSSGSPSPMKKMSQSAAMTYSNPLAIDQSHPQRSSPPPDERHVRPENVVDKRQTISDREFLQQIDAVAPVRFVNTSFGDLMSVTSGLSGTYMEESVMEEYVPVHDVIEAREVHVPARKPAVQPAPAISLEQKSSPVKLLKSLEPIGMESGVPDLSSSNYWEKWVSSACETLFPGSLPSERPRSPTRKVTIPTADNAEETTGHTTGSTLPLKLRASEETTVKHNTRSQAGNSCETESVEGTTPKWLCVAIETKKEMLQQAETVVRNLSDDFDGLVKQALSSSSGESNCFPTQSKKKSKSNPNKIPRPTNKTSGTESSVKVKNALPPRSGARAQADPSKFGALVLNHIRSVEEAAKAGEDLKKGSSDLSSKKNLITKTESTKTGSSSAKNMGGGLSLPPRDTVSRMRVNARSIIAHKKQSASAVPPRSTICSAGVSSSKSFRISPMTNSSPGALVPIPSISQSTGGISEVASSSKKSMGISVVAPSSKKRIGSSFGRFQKK